MAASTARAYPQDMPIGTYYDQHGNLRRDVDGAVIQPANPDEFHRVVNEERSRWRTLLDRLADQ